MNDRYGDFLAELILERGNKGKGNRFGSLAAVINLGISGGQVTDTIVGENALARLERDVLTQSGVSHVVVLAGINDIGLPTLLTVLDPIFMLEALFGRDFPPIEVEQIIAIHQQIASRARRWSHGSWGNPFTVR